MEAHDLNGSHHIRPQSNIAARLYIDQAPSPAFCPFIKRRIKLPSILLLTIIGALFEPYHSPISMYPLVYSIYLSLTYIHSRSSRNVRLAKEKQRSKKRCELRAWPRSLCLGGRRRGGLRCSRRAGCAQPACCREPGQWQLDGGEPATTVQHRGIPRAAECPLPTGSSEVKKILPVVGSLRLNARQSL